MTSQDVATVLPTGMWFCAFHFAYPPVFNRPVDGADCGNSWDEGDGRHPCEWRELYFHRVSDSGSGSEATR